MNVSRETISRLKVYQALLEKWQPRINLISSHTLSDVWQRHFEDSLQLIKYISDAPQSLVDMGSGAGFPGLVLALSYPTSLKVTLIESDVRKSLFMENVSRETNVPVKIISKRIEDVQDIKGDIITARGLSALTKLFEMSFPLMTDSSQCLFLKGKGVDKEIDEAKKNWEFDLEIFLSLTDSTGRILRVKNLRRK